jgi:hypothetical protein
MLEEKIVTCPNCGSQRSYKDGIRYTRTREIQRRQKNIASSRLSTQKLNSNLYHISQYAR